MTKYIFTLLEIKISVDTILCLNWHGAGSLERVRCWCYLRVRVNSKMMTGYHQHHLTLCCLGIMNCNACVSYMTPASISVKAEICWLQQCVRNGAV